MEGRANYLTWLLKNRDSDWSFWRAGGRSVSADHRKTNKGIPHPDGVPEQKPELLWHTFRVRGWSTDDKNPVPKVSATAYWGALAVTNAWNNADAATDDYG